MISWDPRFACTYESPWGIAQKLAWLNVSSSAGVLTAIAGRPVRPSTQSGARAFASLNWWDELCDPGTVPSARFSGRRSVGLTLFGGSSAGRWRAIAQPFTSQRLRLCRTCITAGYHSVAHQLEGLQRCLLHDEQLLNVCLSCLYPLGPYGVTEARGFQCRHCGTSWLKSDHLPVPPETFRAAEVAAIGPIYDWIIRTEPYLDKNPILHRLVLGAWNGREVQLLGCPSILLNFLADIEPFPLDQRFLAPRVVEFHSQHRSTVRCPKLMTAAEAHTLGEQAAASTSSLLWRGKLRGHRRCCERGCVHLWGTHDYLDFHPEFCRLAYAYILWRDRVRDWLHEIRTQFDWFALDVEDLTGRLLSSFYGALHAIDVLCSLHEQGSAAEFDTALACGCLRRTLDPWLEIRSCHGHAHGLFVGELADCKYRFGPRFGSKKYFCDHGNMMDEARRAEAIMLTRLLERRRIAGF